MTRTFSMREAKLLRHEAYLLRWEGYIRRTRHVAFWLAIFFIGMWFMGAMLAIAPPEEMFEVLYMPAFLLLCTYTTTLQVRHIESIKYHMEHEKTAPSVSRTRVDGNAVSVLQP